LGHRLSKIYTRTGDDGTTGLASGERVPKTSWLVAAGGDVDELNSALGLVLSEAFEHPQVRSSLVRVQNELFEVGAAFSLPGYTGIDEASVERIEADLDALNAMLPPLKEFILPGGNRAGAACHLARAVCRRAERTAWGLAEHSDVDAKLLRYLNRLSDYLFVAARSLSRIDGGAETMWRKSP